MNLNELQKGLGDASITEEILDSLQPLYLLDMALTKDQFYSLVSSIGLKSAQRLSGKIKELEDKLEHLSHVGDLEKRIEKLQEEADVNRTVKEALAEKYRETDARYVQLLEKHSEFLRFLKNCPEIETMYLSYKNEEAKKLFDFMTSPV